jgi:hypothetical protein
MEGDGMTTTRNDQRPYEPPRLEVLGGVVNVTATTDKKFYGSDGMAFSGIPLGNASP